MLVMHLCTGGHLEKGTFLPLPLFPHKNFKADKKNLHPVYLQGRRASLISAHAISETIKENEQNVSLIIVNLSVLEEKCCSLCRGDAVINHSK